MIKVEGLGELEAVARGLAGGTIASVRGVLVLCICVIAGFGPTPAAAHHSFAVHFVADKVINVSGTVTEFSFRNPHGLIALTAKGPNGEDQAWKVETNSPNILRRRGWTETSIKPGDKVTIEGYPARDGSSFMRVYKVTFADGRELVGQRPDPTVTDGKD